MSAFGTEFNKIRVRNRVLLRNVSERSDVPIARISAIEQGRATQTSREAMRLATSIGASYDEIQNLLELATVDAIAERFMNGEGMEELAVAAGYSLEYIEDAIRAALKNTNGGK